VANDGARGAQADGPRQEAGLSEDMASDRVFPTVERASQHECTEPTAAAVSRLARVGQQQAAAKEILAEAG
jgi:hypothetical protein